MGTKKLVAIGVLALFVASCDSGENKATNKDRTEKSTEDKTALSSTDRSSGTAAKTMAAIKVSEAHAGSNKKPDAAAVKLGKSIYETNCVACHQEDAIGKPGIAPSLTNPELLEIASDKFFVETIREGRDGTGMPPFEHLGEAKIKAIVAFLRDHSDRPSRAAEVDAQPEAHGDPRLGEQWFRYICATCHGAKGEGYESEGTGTAIGKPGFLDKATDGFIRTTIKVGRTNTRMRGFNGPTGLANLSDQEIDDIIVYLRTLSQNRPEATEQ